MTTSKKLTKRDHFTTLLNLSEVKANPVLVDFIEHELELPPASDFNTYTAPAEALTSLRKLPGSLYEAASIANASAFIQDHLPESVISAYSHR